MKITPIKYLYHNSWILKTLEVDPERCKFTLIGTAYWVRAMSIVIQEKKIEKMEFYRKVQKISHSSEAIKNIISSLLMAFDFYNTLTKIHSISDTDNLIRIAIMAWYYCIYNASQAMLTLNDGSVRQTHSKTADDWYDVFASRNLIPAPFNYIVPALTKEAIDEKIASFNINDFSSQMKPKDLSTAEIRCVSYLRGTAEWYAEQHSNNLKSSSDFRKLNLKNFRTKTARSMRDKFLLKKKIGFLHQAYRFRGKSNYRDAQFAVMANAMAIDSKEFISDLLHISQDFLEITMAYFKKRSGTDIYNLFLNDIQNNTNFTDETVGLFLIDKNK